MTTNRPFRVAVGALLVAVALVGCSRTAASHVDRGTAYVEKGNVDAAVLEFRNAIQKDPAFAPARLKLAEIYERQANRAGALEEYVRAADLLPGDAGVQLKAGALLLFVGRMQDALARADKAIALDARNPDALVLRAHALAGLTDLDGAVEQIRQAIALDPAASRQMNLGVLQLAKGRREEAEGAFRLAVAADTCDV